MFRWFKKMFRKQAEFIGYIIYQDKKFEEWRCPNKECGLGVSEEYTCCPYCGQKIKFIKGEMMNVRASSKDKRGSTETK